jgi:aspartate/methionine/tyrosine aminotransferase
LQHCIYPGMLEETITVNGVAKAFAMTGWELVYWRTRIHQKRVQNSRSSNLKQILSHNALPLQQ